MKCPYCGRHYKIRQGRAHKLSTQDIINIRARRKNREGLAAIAYDFGVSVSLISRYTKDILRKSEGKVETEKTTDRS